LSGGFKSPALDGGGEATMPTALLLAAALAVIFAKGPGKPGTYNVSDGRKFKAGEEVPEDLPDNDRSAFESAGYITTEGSDPEPVVTKPKGKRAALGTRKPNEHITSGGHLEHDVPGGRKGERAKEPADAGSEDPPVTVSGTEDVAELGHSSAEEGEAGAVGDETDEPPARKGKASKRTR
jgi:hypothetical protein